MRIKPEISLLDCRIEEPRWGELDLQPLAEQAVRATLSYLGMAVSGYEVSLLGCNDTRIAELNTEFRGKSRPTNVLSWPAVALQTLPGQRPETPKNGPPDMPVELGDIAIAYETCAKEAARDGKTLEDHSFHLLVHAMLHLLGYNHKRDADAALMEELETEILGKQGLADPYSSS